jgi:hypothetical protein
MKGWGLLDEIVFCGRWGRSITRWECVSQAIPTAVLKDVRQGGGASAVGDFYDIENVPKVEVVTECPLGLRPVNIYGLCESGDDASVVE